MTTEKISLDKIIETRIPNRKRIESIKQTIIKNGEVNFSPIDCKKIDEFYLIRDGSHRYVALKELGYESMWVELIH